MALSKTELREQMIHFRNDLNVLYKGESLPANQNMITNSSDMFVTLLLNLLFRVAASDIPVKKSLYSKIAQSKKAGGLVKYFGSENKLSKMLKLPRAVQVKQLRRFTSVMPVLFYYLFNKPQ